MDYLALASLCHVLKSYVILKLFPVPYFSDMEAPLVLKEALCRCHLGGAVTGWG